MLDKEHALLGVACLAVTPRGRELCAYRVGKDAVYVLWRVEVFHAYVATNKNDIVASVLVWLAVTACIGAKM
jgi:hypothetical protein